MEHSRRNFLKSTALLSSVFVIGLYIPSKSRADTKIEKALEPNAFVRISKDNKIDFIVGQVEMGQGIYTTFAMCIAEELNVNWEAINIMASDVKPVYNSAYGPLMITGGSSSVRTKQTEMRKIGSALNSMLCQAAAKRWKVKIQDVFTKDSKVINSINHKSFTFGELVSDLSQMEIPTDAKIKDLKECTIVGKPMKRHFKEAWAKVSGKAEFSIDVRIDNLKYAAVLHPTIFGSTIKSYDDSNALKKEGILKVKQIPTGIAVIAEHWWQAKEALNDLVVEWDEGTFAKISSDDLHKEYALMMEKEGISMRKDGDSKKAFEDAYKIISAEFDFPFLAHAPIEPESCVVHHTNKSATIWCNAQSKTIAQREIAKALGIEPINVAYNTPYLGSSFGRRAANNFDFMLDAAYAAKGEPWPVMALFSREDDIKMGNYRPMYKNRARMALDKSGKITAFEAKVTGQSIYKNTVFDGILYKDGVDGAQKEGLATHPYAILNNDMQAYTPDSPIPVLWWRSVGHTQSGPFVECMIDEAAHAAGADPVVYRISMLANNQRYITLLKDVATLAHWDERKKEKNVGYGVAIVGSFQSVCAQIAKVRVNESGNDYKVEKVWCSIDCGFAFSPLNVENQVMGSINYGLAAVKYSEITIKNGAAEQNNFYDYQVTRISDAPEIEVSIINSDNPIGGIGEPGTPPIFGAVANAIFDATGKRHHSYPIRLS